MSQYIFNELDFMKAIKTDIEEIFAEDIIYNIIGKEVIVKTSINNTDTNFPCIFIRTFNCASAIRYSTVEQGQQFSDLTLEFDCYSKEFSDYTRDEAITFIKQTLIQGFCDKYPLINLTFDEFMPNLDILVARRIVRFTCTIDNRYNKIYSN